MSVDIDGGSVKMSSLIVGMNRLWCEVSLETNIGELAIGRRVFHSNFRRKSMLGLLAEP